MKHPAVQIYTWFCLVLAVQVTHGLPLVMISTLLVLLSFKISANRFFILLRKTKWILISILLIYAYTGSGNTIWPQFGIYSPVIDGIEIGFNHALRLVVMLAGLSLLLTLQSQPQLISGLYALAYPLTFLGLSRERISVRLALTLGYMESSLRDANSKWRDNIDLLHRPVETRLDYIELEKYRLCPSDWLVISTVSIALFGVW